MEESKDFEASKDVYYTWLSSFAIFSLTSDIPCLSHGTIPNAKRNSSDLSAHKF